MEVYMGRGMAKLFILLLFPLMIISMIIQGIQFIIEKPLTLYVIFIVFPCFIGLTVMMMHLLSPKRNSTISLRMYAVLGTLFLITISGFPAMSVIYEPDVVEQGKVEFGSDYKDIEEGFKIIGRKTDFLLSDEIVYITLFSDVVPTRKVERRIYHVTDEGNLLLAHKHNISLSGENYILVAGEIRFYSLFNNKGKDMPKGTYLVRFISEGRILSEGTFLLN